LTHGVIIVTAVANRFFEDAWVRCNATQAFINQPLQLARFYKRAADIVQPDRLAKLSRFMELCGL